jgi:hypothetical protein
MITISDSIAFSRFGSTILRHIEVIDQNINKVTNAVHSADRALMVTGIICGVVANMVNIRPIIKNKGAPGG